MQLANPSLAPNDSSSLDDFSRPPLHRWRETRVVPPFPLLGTSRIKRRRNTEASAAVEIGIVERSKGGTCKSTGFVVMSGPLWSTHLLPSSYSASPLLTYWPLTLLRSEHFWFLFRSKKVPLCRIVGNDCNATRRLHIKTPANNSGGNCLSLRVWMFVKARRQFGFEKRLKAGKLLKQEGNFTTTNCHDKAFVSGIRRTALT